MLHNNLSDFTAMRRCAPQTLSGFMGGAVTVTQCGDVGNFTDVLYLPTSKANVRSVTYALRQRGGAIRFTDSAAVYHGPDNKVVTIRGNVYSNTVIATPLLSSDHCV